MLRALRCAAALVVALTAALRGSAMAANHEIEAGIAATGHAWTVDDVLAIPQIEQVVLSEDARSLAYVLRVANAKDNRTEFEMHVVTLTDHRDQVVARSAWLHNVQPIPNKHRWSVLGDFGAGVQLYEIDGQGSAQVPASPLVVDTHTVLVGAADGAEPSFSFLAPIRVGIASYSWSPDGQHLFYTTLRAQRAAGKVLTDEAVVHAGTLRRHAPRVTVNFFLKAANSKAVRIATAPDTDQVARWLGGRPDWSASGVNYTLQVDDHDFPTVATYRRNFDGGKSAPVMQDTPYRWTGAARGPGDGLLAVDWINGQRRLREHFTDGTLTDYGVTRLALADPRSPGAWRAPGGAYSLTPVRNPTDGRYALLRIDRGGQTRLIETAESLRNCTFTQDVTRGFCIHEGISLPPRLVSVNAKSGEIRDVLSLSPRHEAIAPLSVALRRWTNALGFKARGFVIYPRGFAAGRRYPAVIVTHGSDADQRFGDFGFQWNYPVQVLAERGYVVVLMADPYSSQSEEIERASLTWSSCDGLTSPEDLRRLLWLNTAESYRTAIAALFAEGLIDANRVGIAGYSAGSQAVNVAVTQTHLFRAASSGDGGYLEPSGYKNAICSYRAVFGGPPGDPRYQANYEALSPTYRAGLTKTPVLQQVADARPSVMDFYLAYRAADKPMAVTLYPGETPASDETHLFHIPSNQRAAMEENIAWFDFWLRDMVPSSESDDNRQLRWQTLRARSEKGA